MFDGVARLSPRRLLGGVDGKSLHELLGRLRLEIREDRLTIAAAELRDSAEVRNRPKESDRLRSTDSIAEGSRALNDTCETSGGR